MQMSFPIKIKINVQCIDIRRAKVFQGNCILFHPFPSILYITHGTFFISRKLVALSRFVIFHEQSLCVKKSLAAGIMQMTKVWDEPLKPG